MSNNGVYVVGVVVSNRAKAFNRKDGSGMTVVVECEIALQPGVAVMQRFLNPQKDAGVKVEGGEVTEYPKLTEFKRVTIRANRLRSDEHSGQLVIKSGEVIETS